MTTAGSDAMLAGVKVLEYAHFVSGPYCGKLLADFGAEVIKVEPPEGEESRGWGPFPGDSPDREQSGLFLYLNTNKTGITLDLECQTGRNIFLRLVKNADILVENNPAGGMRQYGLDYEVLREHNPKLVMVSITPFGQDGRYSKYQSYPLNTFHAGGEGYCLPGGLGYILNPEREPITGGGYIGEYDCGTLAATVSLGLLYRARMTGSGVHIDISAQEALLNLVRMDIGEYNEGIIESRATRWFPVAGLMQCKDGFVQLMPLEKHMWEGLMELMGNPPWSRQEEYSYEIVYGHADVGTGSVNNRNRIQQTVNDYLENWALQHTKQEIYEAGQKHGVPVGMIATPEDLLNSKQLQSRNFFVESEHPRAGKLKYPGAPFKLSRSPQHTMRPAPLLGQHNEEIYLKLGFSREDLVRLREGGVI